MFSRQITRRAFSTTLESLKHPGKKYSVPNQLFINGQYKDAKSGKTFDTVNPGTGELITKVACAGAEDVNEAVAGAKKAFETWSEMAPSNRGVILQKFADVLESHADELATIECEDNGKPYAEAMWDVMYAASHFRYYGSMAHNMTGWSMMRDNDPLGYSNSYAYTRMEPVGVCGIITPWNFPLLMTTWKLAPMLAAGCTGVHKIPENTPLSSLRLVELLHGVEGFVPGAVQVVPGFGNEAGEAVTGHPDISKIAFTGSTAIGKHIMRRAADDLKRVTLELGGKGPIIIFADANLQQAIDTCVLNFTLNSGQCCVASSRLIVEESVYDEFCDGLAKGLAAKKPGYWREEGTNMGPVVNDAQLQKILGYIESGKSQGARLLYGGNQIDRPGFYVEPTLFADAKCEMKMMCDEIFGPVSAVTSFKQGDMEGALQVANNTRYGLNGGVFTEDRRKANYCVRKIQCGQVGNNSYFDIGNDSPFGGYKESGIGREMGRCSLNNYLEMKTVTVDCSLP